MRPAFEGWGDRIWGSVRRRSSNQLSLAKQIGFIETTGERIHSIHSRAVSPSSGSIDSMQAGQP
jgi:hypothetical protein